MIFLSDLVYIAAGLMLFAISGLYLAYPPLIALLLSRRLTSIDETVPALSDIWKPRKLGWYITIHALIMCFGVLLAAPGINSVWRAVSNDDRFDSVRVVEDNISAGTWTKGSPFVKVIDAFDSRPSTTDWIEPDGTRWKTITLINAERSVELVFQQRVLFAADAPSVDPSHELYADDATWNQIRQARKLPSP